MGSLWEELHLSQPLLTSSEQCPKQNEDNISIFITITIHLYLKYRGFGVLGRSEERRVGKD